jgi:hypothetical protein
MNRVRALQLKHVAFRACNVGASNDMMEALFKFFDAASVSAPAIEDTCGTFPPGESKDLAGWIKLMRQTGFHAWKEDKVAIATKRTGGIVYMVKVVAENTDAYKAWFAEHILDAGVVPDPAVYHGMKVDETGLAPDAPSIYFIRDPDFLSRIVNFAGE